MQEAVDGVYKSIGDGLRRHPKMLTSDSEHFGPQQVLNGTSAYILVHSYYGLLGPTIVCHLCCPFHFYVYLLQGKSLNEFIIEREFKKTGKCQLSLAKKEFYKVFQGFVLPKNSPLKPIMDKK